MKKRLILVLLVTIASTALLTGAFFAGHRLGWREGALEQVVLEGTTAMRAGDALGSGDQERAARLVNVMLLDVEGELLRFDNNEVLKLNTESSAGARYVHAETLFKLDQYWQKHPRPVAAGGRVDERDFQKYGLGGGAGINAGRGAYERAYSNAVARARARLGK